MKNETTFTTEQLNKIVAYVNDLASLYLTVEGIGNCETDSNNRLWVFSKADYTYYPYDYYFETISPKEGMLAAKAAVAVGINSTVNLANRVDADSPEAYQASDVEVYRVFHDISGNPFELDSNKDSHLMPF